MATQRLYQKDVYLKEAELVVSEIREYKGKQQVACESTIFFPEGGGQLCDLGTLNGIAVTDVKEDKESGTVWHTVADASGFEPGQKVKAVLDWQRRFDHMQMHCGEHILSGRFFELFGVENHGFHMGEDYMTIDMLAKDGSPITDEMIEKAELAANEVIWRNVPVSTTWFDTAEEALSMPVRKEIKFGEDISVVTVGSIAVTQPELFVGWLKKYGADRMILGADVRNGKISINGWKEDSTEDLLPFLRK